MAAYDLNRYDLGGIGGTGMSNQTFDQIFSNGGSGLSSMMGGMGGYYQMIMQALAGIGQAVSTGVYDTASERMADDLNDLLRLAAGETRDIAGDLDFPEVNIDPMSLIFAFANPNANPYLAAAGYAALQQLGAPTAGVLEQGSPQARLQNELGLMGLSHRRFNQAQKQLAQGGVNKKGEPSKLLNRAAIQAGYSDLDAYMEAQRQYQEQSAQMGEEYAAIADAVRSGRLSATEAISKLQSDYPVPTATSIEELEQRVIDQRRAQIDRNAVDATEAALQRANAMGLNPARSLGDIDEERLAQIYDVEQSDALSRAIQLLSGKQTLATSALDSLQRSLAGPIQSGLQAGAQYSGGVQTAGQLALQQALATNEIMAMQEFFNAQQGTSEQLARTNLLLSALGLQTQGGMIDARGDWQKATSFARGMDQFTSMYGGSMPQGSQGPPQWT